MPPLSLGSRALTIEDLAQVARSAQGVKLSEAAQARIRQGRSALESLLASGTKIYGVNTGIGGNMGRSVSAEQAELFQHNLLRELSCATGQPLGADAVRAAMLLRLVTFATGASGVRLELVGALAGLLNRGMVPVVPRYGSVGASGDLIPSAYVARALVGMGEVDYQGSRLPAEEALRRAGLTPMHLAAKEGLALINGTTVMTAIAALLWVDMGRVLRALLSGIALALEALEGSAEPFAPWVQEIKGHPGQIAVAEYVRSLLAGSSMVHDSDLQSCYSLRCPPQGLGPAWEAWHDARPVIEREMNSANDNPLVDPVTGALHKAGNFYGGHIARLLDGWKIDFAAMATWGNALIAVLVDDKFNRGLPANLVPDPGLNSGLKGLQLSATSLTCVVRQMAGPSSIHSLATEQYNQDVVSLGMHAAVTALDSMECLRNETAMVLITASQAADLRGGLDRLGQGTRRVHEKVRSVAAFLERDRPLEGDIAAVSVLIAAGGLN